VKPYIFSVLPAGTVPSLPSDPISAFNQTALVEIRSSLSLVVSQSVPFPFNVSESPTNVTPGTTGNVTSVANAQIRLMTATVGAKSPLYAITTPVDKTVAANEGSSLWKFDMKPWTEQIDELVLKKKYSDALALLDVLDDDQVSDKVFLFAYLLIAAKFTDFHTQDSKTDTYPSSQCCVTVPSRYV